ncbi:MAG: hypothetical protein PHS92_02760 [Candidatus Gracilibacteria bacterium]|nr:hypothetical protein [Candidatus Gracilibacteria bacterium]
MNEKNIISLMAFFIGTSKKNEKDNIKDIIMNMNPAVGCNILNSEVIFSQAENDSK